MTRIERLEKLESYTDLSTTELSPTIADDLDRYASAVRAIGPSGASRAPFDIARTFARHFSNADSLIRQIDQIEGEIRWDRSGPLDGTISGQMQLTRACADALDAVSGKVRQAEMDARIAERSPE